MREDLVIWLSIGTVFIISGELGLLARTGLDYDAYQEKYLEFIAATLTMAGYSFIGMTIWFNARKALEDSEKTISLADMVWIFNQMYLH